MQFMQIIEITTDRIDELVHLEDAWRVAARGRRTGIADWICEDRSNPGHYFSVNLFPSHDDAMVNGALPRRTSLPHRRRSSALRSSTTAMSSKMPGATSSMRRPRSSRRCSRRPKSPTTSSPKTWSSS